MTTILIILLVALFVAERQRTQRTLDQINLLSTKINTIANIVPKIKSGHVRLAVAVRDLHEQLYSADLDAAISKCCDIVNNQNSCDCCSVHKKEK